MGSSLHLGDTVEVSAHTLLVPKSPKKNSKGWAKVSLQVPVDLDKVLKAELAAPPGIDDPDEYVPSARAVASAGIALLLGAPETVRRELERWVDDMDNAGAAVLNREVTPEKAWRLFEHLCEVIRDNPDWRPVVTTEDRIEMLKQTKETPPEAKAKPSGGRPSARRAV